MIVEFSHNLALRFLHYHLGFRLSRYANLSGMQVKMIISNSCRSEMIRSSQMSTSQVVHSKQGQPVIWSSSEVASSCEKGGEWRIAVQLLDQGARPDLLAKVGRSQQQVCTDIQM